MINLPPHSNPTSIAQDEALPTWTLWHVALVLGAYWAIPILFGLFSGIWAESEAFATLTAGDPARRILYQLPPIFLIAALVGLSLVWWSVRQDSKKKSVWMMLALHRPVYSYWFWAFAMGLILQVAAQLANIFWPAAEIFTSRWMVLFSTGWIGAVWVFVLAVLLAPLVEEVLFRGLLQPVLRQRMRFASTALIVTLVFMAAHLPQIQMNLPTLAALFAGGLLLSWLRDASHSLWPAVVFHVGFNLPIMLTVFGT